MSEIRTDTTRNKPDRKPSFQERDTRMSKTIGKKRMLPMFLAGAGVLVAGFGVAASAVALGIEANNELGAGVSITETCQPEGVGNDIAVGFSTPTYVPADQTFEVAAAVLSNIDAACVGLDVQVVVADATGAELGAFDGVIGGTTLTATLPAAVDSAEVASVAVVIYGD